MSRVDATPAELAHAQACLNNARNELLNQANHLVMNAGFVNKDEKLLGVIAVLIGAAQLAALSQPGLYALFKAACADMARSNREEVVTRSFTEMGPEVWGGGADQ